MLPALAYFATAFLLLGLAWRFVTPFTRAAGIALLLLPLAFTARTLLTGRLMAPVDIQYLSGPFHSLKNITPYDPELLDVATQMVPWRAALGESLGRGEWPLINQHTLCGDVLAGAAQPAAYSPFTLIACLMDPAASFNFTGAMAFFLAALGAFLFARDLGCSEMASLFGAAAFAFNGPLAFAILWPLGFSWVLLPLVMLGARRVVRRRSIGLLTTALVLEVLAGHPESTLHVVTLGAAWGLFEILRVRAEGRGARAEARAEGRGARAEGSVGLGPRPSACGPRLSAFGRALLAGVLALGLTAIYILPVLDAADQTVEHRFRQNVFAKSKRAAPANEIVAGVLTTLFPVLHQQKWMAPMRTPAFIGIGSLVLLACTAGLWPAVSAAFRRRAPGESRNSRPEDRGTTWMLLALFLFCAAVALMAPPVSSLLHALPLFDVTLNERLLFGASFFAAMLAARGFESVGWRTTAVVLILLAAGNFIVMHARLTDGHVGRFRQYTLLGELLPLALVLLVCLAWPREHREGPRDAGVAHRPAAPRRPPTQVPRYARDDIRVIALFALLLAQRVMEDGHWYPAIDPSIAFPKLAVLEPAERSGDRIVGQGMTLLPNTSALYRVDDVRGYEAMTFRPLAETYPLWANPIPIWFNRVDDLNAPMLSMMNVRWMLKDNGGLAENPHALPRAFVPRHVRLATPPELVLPEMRGETDFSERAWIDLRQGEAGLPYDQENGPGIVRDGMATMERDGWVVISQANWRGWRAYMDGRRATVYTANHAFLSVYVPRGRHRLRLAFLPRSFTLGRAVSGATLLLLAVVVLVRRRRGTIAGPDESHDRRLQRSP